MNYVKKDKNKLKYALDNPSKFNLFYGFDSNCDIFKKKPRYLDKFENTLLVILGIIMTLYQSWLWYKYPKTKYHYKT